MTATLRTLCAALALNLAAIASPSATWAHVTVTGLAQISVADAHIAYELSLALPELPEVAVSAIAAAASGDGAAAEALAERVKRGVAFTMDGRPCRPGRVRILGGDASRARLEMELTCVKASGTLSLREDWGDFFGDHYQTLATIRTPIGSKEFALGEGLREVSIDITQPVATGWLDFVRLGIEHILTGYDHLLFLVALLATARGFWSIVKIVTAFTLAHSITLSLASLGLITIPSRIIEPAIAASIVWVALENIFAADPGRRRALISFVFGLVHGFGFAAALEELDLTGMAIARALVGFNLGVEIGQLLFIAAFFPLLLWLMALHRFRLSPSVVSTVVAVFGAYWFVERLLQA
jgi:hydrogenase/urease accessory protein HupE